MIEEDEVAFNETEGSISHDGTRYEIRIPWKIDSGNYNKTHFQVEKQ